jgi:hypothetical protein
VESRWLLTNLKLSDFYFYFCLQRSEVNGRNSNQMLDARSLASTQERGLESARLQQAPSSSERAG